MRQESRHLQPTSDRMRGTEQSPIRSAPLIPTTEVSPAVSKASESPKHISSSLNLSSDGLSLRFDSRSDFYCNTKKTKKNLTCIKFFFFYSPFQLCKRKKQMQCLQAAIIDSPSKNRMTDSRMIYGICRKMSHCRKALSVFCKARQRSREVFNKALPYTEKDTADYAKSARYSDPILPQYARLRSALGFAPILFRIGSGSASSDFSVCFRFGIV